MSTPVAGRGPAPVRLVDRRPQVPRERLLAELVPPPRFAAERFSTYRPAPDQPSQAAAVERLRSFAGRAAASSPGGGGRGGRGLARWRPGSRRPRQDEPVGVYLDGGFGVGKTHLLAALWHEVAPGGAPGAGAAAFGTFVEFTNLVGALGFRPAVDGLSGCRLVCVDEFELDDPGDTVLMSRLLRELADAGVRLAATSNTLPDALGEGRFAAEDFRREIQGMAQRFEVVRVDGEDYRHRGVPQPPRPLAGERVRALARERPGVTLDAFDDLLGHLAEVHPSRYGALLDGVRAVALTGVAPVTDQAVALRLVVLVDRIYDRDLPVLAAGEPVDRLFPPDLLSGGYRKKYRRALSRLIAMAREGEALAAA